MMGNTNNRLWVLRLTGILLMCVSVYIAWYTMSSGKPRDFWKEKMNPKRGNITEIQGEFEDQDGRRVSLKEFQNKQVIATFVFKDCNMSCPFIMSDLKFFDAENPAFKENGVFLVFTFEDHRGHSDQLKEFLRKYRVVGNHWRVLTSDAKTIRQLADTFELQYNKGENGNYVYMHTNFYVVADKTGKVKREFRGMEPNKAKFVGEIRAAL